MSLGPLVPRNSDGLRGLQPTEPEFLRPVSALYTAMPSQESTLREYMRVLIKRKWLVLAVAAGIFMTVAIASLRQTPIYEAVGRIVVNKADSNVITFKDSMPVMDYYDQSDLDTEVRILQSDLMALQVIRQLNLDRRPEFGGRSDQKQANLVADPLQTDSNRTSALLGAFRANLHVSLIPSTRIMEIHYNSTDPQLAASAVNTLAATYVEQNFKTKFESTMQASDWLSKQLVDLQMKVETSQEKLVRYQKEHEILGIDEKQNIITEKLDELNKEMTMAESDRMQKEAVYRQTESNDPEAIAAAIFRITRPAVVEAAQAPLFWTSYASNRPISESRLPNSAPSLVLPIPRLCSSTIRSKKSTTSSNRRPTKPSITSKDNTWLLCSVRICCAPPLKNKRWKRTNSTRAPLSTAS